MSAPDTDVEKQKKNHRPSLMGTKGALVIGGVIIIAAIFYASLNGGEDAAVTATESDVTVAPTDIYEPGTNTPSTPTVTD